MKRLNGKLVLVATPIGNLGDITLRARHALAEADAVYAEDTRVTGKLLRALEIDKPIIRLDEQIMGARAGEVVNRVLSGDIICYCTDAGMPGVSDPGSRLVAAARSAGAETEVLPGASAVISAYVASASQNARFYFGGFFPRKAVEAHALLQSLRNLDAALIFYESPKRLVSALETIADVFPYREAAVCREMTKLHEEILRARTGDLLDAFKDRESSQQIKGEIVVVIDGPTAEEAAQDESCALVKAADMAAELRCEGMRAKDIAKRLVDEFDISRNKAYGIALDER